MSWAVAYSRKAAKQKRDLPSGIAARLYSLQKQLESTGPLQPSFPHFGKLRGKKGEMYHCHLNKGRPTYVAVWQAHGNEVTLIEVTYVGTHENAPY